MQAFHLKIKHNKFNKTKTKLQTATRNSAFSRSFNFSLLLRCLPNKQKNTKSLFKAFLCKNNAIKSIIETSNVIKLISVIVYMCLLL